MPTILTDFFVILYFRGLIDCLFLLLTILIMVITKLKETVIENFLPRVHITNYKVLIDGRNCCDQPIDDQIKKYDEIRKIATAKRDDYATGCLLDYQYFKDHYQ